MRPPPGFESQKFPLRHKFLNAAGLSIVTTGKNSCMFPVIRHYKGANNPSTVDVNPHNSNFVRETGAICNNMSIIDRLKIKLDFTFTLNGYTAKSPLKCWWQPIFMSFPEKLDAADDVSGTTVAAILEIVKDATQEDVTPLYNNLKHDTTGASDRTQPVSTVNLTETFGILNMDTDLTNEGVTWDDSLMQDAMQYYTNKGALKACIGRRRFMVLSEKNPHQSYFVNKRPPKAVRRVMPYSTMLILCHVPLVSEDDQVYLATQPSASVAFVGVTMKTRYHEWHFEHNQDQSGT